VGTLEHGKEPSGFIKGGKFPLASVIRVMVAVRISETLIKLNQSTQHYNLEDSYICIHRRENLRSNFDIRLNTKEDLRRPRKIAKVRTTLRQRSEIESE
jgi:hypothetical protein